jgi:hypothetical protein
MASQMTFFTIIAKDVERIEYLARMGKPQFQGWSVVGVFCGWFTIEVPAWTGSVKDFYAQFMK